MKRTYILWITLLCLLLAGSTNVSARTITVGHTADADYWTIQEAVNAANLSGDTIQVMVGTYNENVVVSKSVILQSDDKSRTIIDGGEHGIVVEVTANNMTIREFTIQGGSTGVQISSGNNTVTGNTIRNPSYAGIHTASTTTHTTISSNTIEGVSGGNNAYGIFLSHGSTNTILNNTIKEVSAYNGFNIYLHSSSNNIITNNTLTACGVGIWLTSGSTMNHIYHNNILDSIHHSGLDRGGNNGWDNGQTSGGNYWSDYTGNDTDGDGIGNEPYYISGGMDARDNYPFMEKDSWMDANVTPTPPVDLIPATDSDGDGVPNVWDVDNSTQEDYWVNPQGIGRRWGDMNGDGVLTSTDALMILQAAAGRIEID